MSFFEKNCNTYIVNIMRFYAPNKNKVNIIILPGTVFTMRYDLELECCHEKKKANEILKTRFL